jgi:hypothetical protein
MEASAAYMRFYAAALLSAREKAPSLLPVLVTLNEVPHDFLAWVEAQVGGRPLEAWQQGIEAGCRSRDRPQGRRWD